VEPEGTGLIPCLARSGGQLGRSRQPAWMGLLSASRWAARAVDDGSKLRQGYRSSMPGNAEFPLRQAAARRAAPRSPVKSV
jgi:hypothetical protein